MLLHREKEVAFCFVPKSACTTFKILFLHTQGLLTDNYLDYEKQMQPRIMTQLRKIQLKSKNKEECKRVKQNYFKFVMFRHPLERLLSGYRSKMSVAMRKNIPEEERDIETNKFLREKKEIVRKAYPEEYEKWSAQHESYPVNITFGDFIDHWFMSKQLSSNSHFNTLVSCCKPCGVNYNYFGNFKTFKEDAQLLMDKIGASEDELRPQYPEPSDQVFNEFYSQLSEIQKTKVVKKLAPDLRLYYMLFPPETDSHKQMLRINVDI